MDELTRKALEMCPTPWSVNSEGNRMVSLSDADGVTLVRMNEMARSVAWLALAAEAVNAYVAAIADAYPASHPNELKMLEFVLAGGERLRLTLGDARKAAAALKAVEGEEATP